MGAVAGRKASHGGCRRAPGERASGPRGHPVGGHAVGCGRPRRGACSCRCGPSAAHRRGWPWAATSGRAHARDRGNSRAGARGFHARRVRATRICRSPPRKRRASP